ncbi:MAG: hypothetical protein IPM54_17750 [Polyangiaceae bacterium]|nr:hypothetical protein [Polyangiaceae bacterium]
MARILQGPEGFYYAWKSVRRDIPIENLARVSRAGELRFVVDYYDVWLSSKENEHVYLEQLESLLDLDPDDDRGFYESDSHDVTAKALFEKLVETEIEEHVPAMVEHFGEKLESITVFANVQYRLLQDEWDDMLAYLNRVLPEELRLTMEELRTFDNGCLEEFDPELHEAHRDDGTLFLQWFLDNDPEGLAYIAFRIFVHAIQDDLEVCDIDDEARWRRTIYAVDDEEDDEDDEEDDEDAEDDEGDE